MDDFYMLLYFISEETLSLGFEKRIEYSKGYETVIVIYRRKKYVDWQMKIYQHMHARLALQISIERTIRFAMQGLKPEFASVSISHCLG